MVVVAVASVEGGIFGLEGFGFDLDSLIEVLDEV